MPLPPPANRAQACTRTRLSGGPAAPAWAIAVFAHNEAGRVGRALASIATAAGGRPVEIFVLDNGSSDATADEVRACAASVPHLNLIEIALGDKANAWNLFVHEFAVRDGGSVFDLCFFMDADVTLEPDAMDVLAFTLEEMPGALAAGGMPANGRDRDAWRARMVANGMLAGNFYCLRGSFVSGLRAQGVRLPIGLIGEDFLVSWLVAQRIGAPDVQPDGSAERLIPGAPAGVRILAGAPSPCAFHQAAQFRFRSLSPWRPGDIRTYLRRKWRYTLRALQFQMLTMQLARFGVAAMPADMDELYRDAPLPSRLQWAGIDTLMRTVAVLRIRARRRRAQAALEGQR
ncbi:MAG: glycosyltransferase [Burkholderiales bacterium]|nr:glycosyltransferase [Burkholderiales bacterium]